MSRSLVFVALLLITGCAQQLDSMINGDSESTHTLSEGWYFVAGDTVTSDTCGGMEPEESRRRS